MPELLPIGAAAPEFLVHAERGTLAPVSTGQPRVLAVELAAALGSASDALLSPTPAGMTRRQWVTSCLVAGFALTLLRGCKHSANPVPAPSAEAAPAAANEVDIVLEVNGKRHALKV